MSWQDYKELEYWFINSVGGVIRPSDTEDWEQEDAAHHKEIGNCFETKEEAELAVRKLKAWKRLKDKGIKIIDYECCGGVSKKGEFLGEVKVTIDVPQDVDKYLFETLFGGEE